MLWSLNHLRHYRIRATDGSLGAVEDIFFDDAAWTVRYLVVDTAWLFGRRVLLPPDVLEHPDAVAREFPVALNKEQVKNSPDIDADQPVSRQQEIDLYGYYGWAPYWGVWAAAPLPPDGVVPPATAPPAGESERQRGDPHLRSGREVIGYHLRATDDSVGHVADLLIDEAGWIIRYLVVDTGGWLPGRKVLLAPNWVRAISWAGRDVVVALSRAEIESSPEYDPAEDVARDYEDRLHRHYGRTGYWI